MQYDRENDHQICVEYKGKSIQNVDNSQIFRLRRNTSIYQDSKVQDVDKNRMENSDLKSEFSILQKFRLEFQTSNSDFKFQTWELKKGLVRTVNHPKNSKDPQSLHNTEV